MRWCSGLDLYSQRTMELADESAKSGVQIPSPQGRCKQASETVSEPRWASLANAAVSGTSGSRTEWTAAPARRVDAIPGSNTVHLGPRTITCPRSGAGKQRTSASAYRPGMAAWISDCATGCTS